MNYFSKIFLVIAMAVMFLTVPASASKNFYFGIGTSNASFYVCKGAGCYVAAMPFVSDYLSWNYQHNRTSYLYRGLSYDIYGEPVYSYPSYGYGYPYYGYYYPPKTSPPASVRNTQALSEQQKRESEFTINANKYKSSASTSRIVPKSTTSTSTARSTTTTQTGWREVIPTTSYLDSTTPNTLIFAPEESEVRCSTLGFVFDAIDVESNQSVTKHLYIKNSAGQDFFVDSVSVEENEEEFNAFGRVLDKKIPASDRARISVTVDAFEVEKDAVEDIEVKVRGHFESGKMCTIEQDFFVGVKGSRKEVSLDSYSFSAPAEIEIDGSGFAMISLDNPTKQDFKITITSGEGAIVHPNTIRVPAESFVERLISINQASQNEFIYYTISSKGQTLAQKYSKIIFPEEEKEPKEPELEEDEDSVRISSYSSRVMFVGGRTDISVALQNTSNSAKEVFVGLSNLPKGAGFNPIVLTIGPSDTRAFNLEVVDAGIEEFPFNAILEVSFEGQTLSRQVVFEKAEDVLPPVEPGVTQPPQEPIQVVSGFISTGLLALQENAFAIGLVLLLIVVLVVVLALLTSNPNTHNEVWVAKESN